MTRYENYTQRSYVANGSNLDDYGLAYIHGVHSSIKFEDRSFDEIEPDLGREWGAARSTSTIEWERAREASRDS